MARILIADDDPSFRALLKVALESGRHEVLACSDGQEAWERLEQGGAELAVLDLNMPRMDGLEVCRRVRAEPRLASLPVLLLTIRDLVDDQVRGYDSGADEYLAKPFDKQVLLARVQALLQRSRRP